MTEPVQMSLSDLVAALGEARLATTNCYEAYKEVKGIEDNLRYELEQQLKAEGLKSVKGANFSAVITETPCVVVKHESSVIDWLRNTPDVEADQYIGLKATEFQNLAKTMLKGTGEVIPGTEVEVRESLAIRANKSTKKVQG